MEQSIKLDFHFEWCENMLLHWWEIIVKHGKVCKHLIVSPQFPGIDTHIHTREHRSPWEFCAWSESLVNDMVNMLPDEYAKPNKPILI